MFAFAAVGGTGLAGGLAKPGKAQYAAGQYKNSDKKATICHKGKVTIRVSINALPAHKQHGDDVGMCPALAAAKAKAVKAAKQRRTTSATRERVDHERAREGPGGKGVERQEQRLEREGRQRATNGKGNGKEVNP